MQARTSVSSEVNEAMKLIRIESRLFLVELPREVRAKDRAVNRAFQLPIHLSESLTFLRRSQSSAGLVSRQQMLRPFQERPKTRQVIAVRPAHCHRHERRNDAREPIRRASIAQSHAGCA